MVRFGSRASRHSTRGVVVHPQATQRLMNVRLFVLAATSALLIACTRVGTTSANSGALHSWTHPDEMRIAMTLSPNTLDPLLTTQELEVEAEALAFDPLIATDAKGHDVPMLAARVPTLENGDISRDGLSIVYHLRHGVVWQDGAPFTSHDVAFTWSAVMNPKSNIITRHGYDDVLRVDTPDKYTAIFRLLHPFAPAVHTFFATSDSPYFILPAHLLERYPSLNGLPFNAKPVGTGPFRVARWLRGDRIEYVANDRYYLGKPKLRRVVLHFVPDENTIVEQMRSHELDWFIQATPRVYPQLRGIGGINVHLVPFNGNDAIEFNTTRPPWSDPRLRRAVGLAINKGSIVEKVTYGTTVAATEDIPSFMWAFNPRAGTAMQDVATAKRLLDSAGWRVGTAGIRANGSRRLSLELAYRNDSLTDRNLAVVLQSMLHAVGIDVTLKSYALALYYGPPSLGGILASGKYEAGLLVWYAGTDPDDSTQLICSQRPPNGYDWARYCNAQMDAAQSVALTKYDRPTRTRAYATIQELLARDNPLVYLWWPRQIEAVNSDLKNFQPNGIIEDWNSYEWSF